MGAAQEKGILRVRMCVFGRMNVQSTDFSSNCVLEFVFLKQTTTSEVGAGSTAERCHLPRGQSHFCVWMGSFLENCFLLMAKCL